MQRSTAQHSGMLLSAVENSTTLPNALQHSTVDLFEGCNSTQLTDESSVISIQADTFSLVHSALGVHRTPCQHLLHGIDTNFGSPG